MKYGTLKFLFSSATTVMFDRNHESSWLNSLSKLKPKKCKKKRAPGLKISLFKALFGLGCMET